MNLENRNVSLHCPICGNDQFLCLDEEVVDLADAPYETKIRCADCNSVFTKADLIDGNQDIINANIEDIKNEALKEIQKELKKLFK